MPKAQQGGFLVVLGAFVLLIMVGGGAYYLSSLKKTPSAASDQIIEASAKPSLNSSPVASGNQVEEPRQNPLPPEWTFQKSDVCNVSFPVPPKKEPYTTSSLPSGGAADDNGRFWKFLPDNESQMFFFTGDSAVSFSPLEESQFGNDYTPGSVHVFCAPNTEKLTTDQVVTKLENNIIANKYDNKLVNKHSISKWGVDVMALNLQGTSLDEKKDIYIFSKRDKMYLIIYTIESQNQIVKDTTLTILNNLRFIN